MTDDYEPTFVPNHIEVGRWRATQMLLDEMAYAYGTYAYGIEPEAMTPVPVVIRYNHGSVNHWDRTLRNHWDRALRPVETHERNYPLQAWLDEVKRLGYGARRNPKLPTAPSMDRISRRYAELTGPPRPHLPGDADETTYRMPRPKKAEQLPPMMGFSWHQQWSTAGEHTAAPPDSSDPYVQPMPARWLGNDVARALRPEVAARVQEGMRRYLNDTDS